MRYVLRLHINVNNISLNYSLCFYLIIFDIIEKKGKWTALNDVHNY